MLDVLRKIVQEVSVAPNLESVLNLIVTSVQRSMKTEVCSVYLFDPSDQRYVLMASEGLNPEAVGSVRLSAAEGLVGLVVDRAEPINLENASEHRAFKYVESTGEERFNSFLGVPIIHHRDVLGVLVVQQRDLRRFDESEEAFLVTLSAQLAGVIAHAEATGSLGTIGEQEKAVVDLRFEGVAGSSGVAIGSATVIAPPADLSSVPDKPAKDVAKEIASFEEALKLVRRDIKVVGRSLAQRLRTEEQALFDVYLRMLDDNALAGEVVARIEKGNWAQGALREVVTEHVRQFSMMDDPYLRERATDIKDLGRRVLAYLQEAAPASLEFTDETILVADELTPAMLGEVPSEKLVGLVSVHGSSNSHAAILARSMGIPTIMGAVDLPLTRIDGRQLILDGYSGRIYVQPGEDLLTAYQDIVKGEKEQAEELAALKDLPAETTDGFRMPLWVNTGLIADVARSLERGAEGIGLYRTEVPFMIRDFFPSEQEQAQTYRKQLEAFHPRPVTMRTLDIGGDKALPYFPIEEENPFLGWRGIRVTLDHPEIFLVQVRAMLKAGEGYENLRIMLPMVTSVREVEEANRQIDRAVRELQEEGHNIKRPLVGVMVEVPAAVYQVRRFARRVDFISVGSNDLTQYLLAVDRNNPRVADLYVSYHPAVLKALEYIAREAHKENASVSICGEVASEPGGALLLMAMGYDVLSMNATNLPKVKAAIRKITKTDADRLLKDVMSMDDADRIQALINERLDELGIALPAQPNIPN
ncbi:phosphoenolpyruvate--protein phosphotransferase [Neptuniibacter caesariensis]|uniref:phosphoenolpyruvate--protein phosphotransferase n=1 Tax=Neptuniibacter caesariensis TaxID=207954 RepID=A0A7U8GSI0_NEPCE|nr:phosphoenolpyruvate--protein phosphotransferase [Neptuniibacter caesariensis]EAR61105.1 phosphoenolpyruvate-protein phosphotransferase PtsP [Oceanospirillum sp. MED92] [Neptuniibacter caesariensis]